MIEIYAAGAVALMAIGAAIGTLFLFAVWIRREDRAKSLPNPDPSPIAGGMRGVLSAYVHPQLPELTNRRRQDLVLTGSSAPTGSR